MKSPPFDYIRAKSLDDAHQLLAAAGSAVFMAGGQSLLAGLAFRLSDPGLLIDISRVPELRGIHLTSSSQLSIGALTTHAELGRDPLVRMHAPLFADAAPLIAHAAIRNRGTLAGSLAYADPAAELPACCVAAGASIIATSPRGERRIPAEAFFTGLFTTALAPDELIRAVEIPPMRPGSGATILELARRSGDYAMAGIALVVERDSGTLGRARPVFFGVGAGPVFAKRAAAALAAGGWTSGAIVAAQAALDRDLDPPGDMHGSPAFKRQLARVLLVRAIARLQPQNMVRAA